MSIKTTFLGTETSETDGIELSLTDNHNGDIYITMMEDNTGYSVGNQMQMIIDRWTAIRLSKALKVAIAQSKETLESKKGGNHNG